jgi:hypothetical protein
VEKLPSAASSASSLPKPVFTGHRHRRSCPSRFVVVRCDGAHCFVVVRVKVQKRPTLLRRSTFEKSFGNRNERNQPVTWVPGFTG